MKPNVNHPAYVVAFAGIVSAAFTAAIMSLHAAAAGTVHRNEETFRRKALVDVFGLARGEATDGQVRALYDAHVRRVDRLVADPQGGTVFNDPQVGDDRPGPKAYLCLGDDGRVAAIAFPVWGTGFWARIDGYLAVTPDLSEVVGLTFVAHSETPGLGGRITEPAWRRAFRGLRVDAPAGGGAYLYVGGPRPAGPDDPRYGRRVDAITGATGTSAAVDRFLNEKIAQFRRAAAAAGLAR